MTNLDKLMIEYNSGFILNLSLENKLQLKSRIAALLSNEQMIAMDLDFCEKKKQSPSIDIPNFCNFGLSAIDNMEGDPNLLNPPIE